MEDDRRAVLDEHLPHALLLLAVGQHGDRVQRVAVLDQLALDLEQVVLGVVEQDQPRGPHARDLAAQLGADRAAGAGDHHDAPGEVAADALDLHAHRLAPQHVLDVHLAHLAQQPPAGAQQLEHGRHRPHRHAALTARADHLGAQRARRRRDRDEDLVGLDVVEHAAELPGRPEHAHAAVDPHVLLAGVVVDEADRAIAEVRVAQDLAQQQPATVAGADDQHRARVAPRAPAAQRPLVDQVHHEARAADEHEHQQPVEDEHAGRHVDRDEPVLGEDQPRLDDRDVRHQAERRHQHRLRDLQVLGLGRVAHPVPIEPEQPEDHDAAEDGEADRPLQQVLVDGRDALVEPKSVGKVIGQRDQHRVQRDLRHRVTVDGEGRGPHPAAHPRHSSWRSGQRQGVRTGEAR